MQNKTLSQLVTDVQNLISQVSGVSTQIYSEDVIAAFVQKGFELIRLRDEEWPSLYTWETRTLDGVTGKVTNDFTQIKNFHDIRRIFPSDSDVPLKMVPTSINPNRLSGAYAQFYEPYADTTDTNRLFTVYPLQSTNTLNVRGRIHFDPFTANSIVPFDALCLAEYAAWCYCIVDGANMGQAELHRVSFDARLKQLAASLIRPISLTPHDPMSVNMWTEDVY